MADNPNTKLNVYDLGSKGVNLVSSPIHLTDGEIVAGQNAEFYREQGRGALRKRPALRRVNTSVLAGTVGGIINVPLPGPGDRRIYALSADAGSTKWQIYNGTAWAVSSAQSDRALGLHSNGDFYRCVKVGQQLYYVTIDSTADGNMGVVLAFDGVSEGEVCRLRRAVGLLTSPLCASAGRLYLSEYRATTVDGAIYEFDPATGAVRRIADTPFAPPAIEAVSGVFYLGKLWVGTHDNSAATYTGKLYSARLEDTAFVLERTAAANHDTYMDLAVYKGNLYAGTRALNGATEAIIEKRTPAGTWSTSLTGTTVSSGNAFFSLAVFNNLLFAIYYGVGTVLKVYKFDGASWSIDKDLYDGTESPYGGQMVVVGSNLYVTGYATFAYKGRVWKRDTAGTWTNISGASFPGADGLIGAL